MAKADYTYAVARIRSKELGLFSKKELNELLALPDYRGCLSYLYEKGWGDGSDSRNSDELLKAEEKKLWDLMRELVREEDAFDVFLVPNDFHNLKVSIKAVTRDAKPDFMFIENSKTPIETVYEAIKNQKYMYLPAYLQQPAQEAMSALLQTSDGQLCDVLIDKACLETVFEIGQQSDNDIIRLYAEVFVASADIKTAVRCAKIQKNLAFIRRALAPCQSVNVTSLALAASKGIEEICAYLSATSYKEAVDALRKSPSAFEKYCDDMITSKMRTQKWEPFTIGPLIAYCIARQNEIKAVRLILSAKRNDLDETMIKERLREMYV